MTRTTPPVTDLERRLRDIHTERCPCRGGCVADYAARAAAVAALECAIDIVATSGDLFGSVVDQAEQQKRLRALKHAIGEGKP